MKILYAIQGTGNGHAARALDLVPAFLREAETDVLISGSEHEISFPFDIKHRFHGMGFVFGSRGGVDLMKTWKMADSSLFFSECASFDVQQYDLIISDFEPVSSWACRLAAKPCISLSHQAAVVDPASPKVNRFDPIGRLVLNNYAPSSLRLGFHFKQWSPNIFLPIIGKDVRALKPSRGKHITVYLPAYDDHFLSTIFNKIKGVEWEVFSKRAHAERIEGNVTLKRVNRADYLRSLESCAGLLCGAGFEAPAEAMFLGKKLMVSPMRNQLEQHLNALAADEMGASVINKISNGNISKLWEWIRNAPALNHQFLDQTEEVVKTVIQKGLEHQKIFTERDYPHNPFFPLFRRMSGKKQLVAPVTEYEWSQGKF
jgi:uncharacterized protein (TIGR00661 family)